MGLKSANQIDIIQSNWGPLFPTTTEISQQTICPILNSTSFTTCFILKLLKSFDGFLELQVLRICISKNNILDHSVEVSGFFCHSDFT